MTNSLPKISIITPSFNQGEFLEECIDSILGQNYPNLEYIIMDGGSSDNSVEIIKKYQRYLTYWQSQPDGGQYAAIEDGFSRSTGEIMAWLNSDDKYHHHAFYKVAYAFSTFPHPDWIVGRQTCWDKNGDVSFVDGSLTTYCRNYFLEKRPDNPYIQQESSFWRRTLWEKAGSCLRKDLDYAGDYELWLRFFRHADLQTVDAILGGFRNHGNQKSALFMNQYIAETETVLDQEIALFNSSEEACSSAPPAPLTIPAAEVVRYLNTACAGSEIKPFQLEDESDKITICLLRQLETLRKELDSVRRSLSWRITEPLRRFGGKFR